MVETMNGNIDQLPELGTKAAAVAAIESLIFRAIGAKDLEPLQLRYWLDAYYQARIAAAGWMEAPKPDKPLPITELDGTEQWHDDGIPHWYHVTPLRSVRIEPAALGALVQAPDDIIARTIRNAAKEAGIEIEDEAGPMRASAPTVETQYSGPDLAETMRPSAPTEETDCHGADAPRNDSPEADGVDAAETQQKPEPAAKPQRQRPVGLTDGFEPVELKKSGAAEAAAFKREQFERLQRFLREGVTMKQIVKAADGNITEDQILGIRECRRVPVAVYRVLEAALDRIETE